MRSYSPEPEAVDSEAISLDPARTEKTWNTSAGGQCRSLGSPPTGFFRFEVDPHSIASASEAGRQSTPLLQTDARES